MTSKTVNSTTIETFQTEKTYADIGHGMYVYRRVTTAIGGTEGRSYVRAGFANEAQIKALLHLDLADYATENELLQSNYDIIYVSDAAMAGFAQDQSRLREVLDETFPENHRYYLNDEMPKLLKRLAEQSIDVDGRLANDTIVDLLLDGTISSSNLARWTLSGAVIMTLQGTPVRRRITCECPNSHEIDIDAAWRHLKTTPGVSNLSNTGSNSPFDFDFTPNQTQMDAIYKIYIDQNSDSDGQYFDNSMIPHCVLMLKSLGLYPFLKEKWFSGYGIDETTYADFE